MNSITLNDGTTTYTLVEGPFNFFRLRVGVGPSFGFFRCDNATYTALTAAPMTTVDLAFSWSRPNPATELTDTDTITINNLYLIKATPVLENMYDIILADERILWPLAAGTTGYNLYVPDPTKTFTSGANSFHHLTSKNGASEWFYDEAITQVFADITSDLTGTWTVSLDGGYAPVDISPRNVQGVNRPIPAILALLLRESSGFLVPDDLFNTHAYKVYRLGTSNITDYDLATLQTSYAGTVHTGGEVWVNDSIAQGDNTRVLFGETPWNAVDADTFAAGVEANDGSEGQNTIFANYSHFKQGSNNNESYLNTIAAELGDDLDFSFDNENLDVTLVGWYDYATGYLGPVIHEIEWGHTTELGAYTRLKAFDAREPIQAGEQRRPSFVQFDEGMPRPITIRRGIAEILTNTDSGTYTVKVLEYYTAAWQDSLDKPYDDIVANDYRSRPSGYVGQKVPFWQEVDREGKPTTVFIDAEAESFFAKLIDVADDTGTEPAANYAYGFQQVDLTGTTYEGWSTVTSGYGDGTTSIPAYNLWEDNYDSVLNVQAVTGNARTDGVSSELCPDGLYFLDDTQVNSKDAFYRDDRLFRIVYNSGSTEWRIELVADAANHYWAWASGDVASPINATYAVDTGVIETLSVSIRDLTPVPENTIVRMWIVGKSNASTKEFWFHSAPHMYDGKTKCAGDNVWLLRVGDEMQHIHGTSGCCAAFTVTIATATTILFDPTGHYHSQT